MKMMQFLLTNKLGQQFNWAGSAPKNNDQKRKRAFKDTKMSLLLNGKEHQLLIYIYIQIHFSFHRSRQIGIFRPGRRNDKRCRN